jgi:hypothetical protein
MEQTPSIGRIVHYVTYGAGAHRAAIITDVGFSGSSGEPTVVTASLAILNPTEMFFAQHLPFDPTGQQPGSWHWPERT